MRATITNLSAQIIKTSHDSDTIEAKMEMSDGRSVLASVPSGQSTGSSEVKTAPPPKAIEQINGDLSKLLIGSEVNDIYKFDELLRTINGLGANSILACSLCAVRYLAKAAGLQLWEYISRISNITPNIPTPMMVMIEGGKHSAYDGVKWQEFLLNASKIEDGKRFLDLSKSKLQNEQISFQMGFEGGWSADIGTNEQALDMFLNIFDEMGKNNSYSIDTATTHYDGELDVDKLMKSTGNHILSIEDPAGENEWEKWAEINTKYGDKIKIIADDLTTTNTNRLEKAIATNACSGVVIKPDQIGSVSGTLDFTKLAKKNNYTCIVSHRAEETNDDFIADLAVGIGADYLKSGAPTQAERMAKYNRLNIIKTELRKIYGN